jgi:uncharacterized protein YbjT (DUF2867 family)
MFVVLGATGNTGRVAAETLLAAGQKVRVVVRNAEAAAAWKEKGAEAAIATLEDAGALEAAFRGAEGVYFLVPPDVRAEDYVGRARRLSENAARALQAAGVPHVVLLSSVGAHQAAGTGPIASVRAAEQVFSEVPGLARTFLRPSYFLDNWASVLPVAKAQGVLPTFLPAGLTIPQIATADIGRAAARALLDPPARGETRVVDLVGAVEANANDIAKVVAELIGKPVAVVEQPLDAVVPTFESFGISAHLASLYREMFEGIANGTVAYPAGAQPVRGQAGPREGLAPLLG